MAYIQNFNTQKTPEELQAEQLSSVKSGSSSMSSSENSAPAGNFAELRNYISQSSVKPTDVPVANAQTTAAIKTPEPVQNTATARIPASNFANIQDYVNRNSQQNTNFQTGGINQDTNVNLNKLPINTAGASIRPVVTAPVQQTPTNQIKNEVRYTNQKEKIGNPETRTTVRFDDIVRQYQAGDEDKYKYIAMFNDWYSDENLKKNTTELSSTEIDDILKQFSKGY